MKRFNKTLSLNETKAIDVFVTGLFANFGPEVAEARLFGSKARGDAGPDSDLDILILVKNADYTLKHAILWLAAEVSLTYNVLLSPRVIPVSAWQTMSESRTLFYRSVCGDSIPLANYH